MPATGAWRSAARGLLDEHLQRLRALPAHGNTKLHAGQLVLGLLLAFFEPMARSPRRIEGCGDFAGSPGPSRRARRAGPVAGRPPVPAPVDFSFIAAVPAKGNDLVPRVKANQPAARVRATLPPTARDAEAGVAADELVELTGRDAPAGTFRRVTIVTTGRRGEPGTVRLLSNLIDAAVVAAHVVGAAYRLRRQVELFFRWLKCFARMGHLLSTSRRGITTQLYIAVIAVPLMDVQTGRRASAYALAALGRVARGRQTIQQAMAFLARRERERELARARQARRRARKKLA